MFDELSNKLDGVLGRFRQRGLLTEPMIREGLREIRRVLLEADVNYKVTREFLNRVQERALPRYPHWFEAFVEGYGLTIDEGIEARLRALSALHGIGCVVWATEHGDGEFAQAGHTLLGMLAEAEVS